VRFANPRYGAAARRERQNLNMVANLATQPNDAELASFPDSPFRLYQPFPPAGDQPQAIDQLVDGDR